MRKHYVFKEKKCQKNIENNKYDRVKWITAINNNNNNNKQREEKETRLRKISSI